MLYMQFDDPKFQRVLRRIIRVEIEKIRMRPIVRAAALAKLKKQQRAKRNKE